MKKKISIVIPCHNCADTISDTWNSLKSQSMNLNDLECIFVDDASDDDGATWLKLMEIESQAPDSVLIVHLKDNMRQGGARNVGISYATGRYLQFLDADDKLTENACLRLYSVAEEKNADIIQFNHLLCLGDTQKVVFASSAETDYVIKEDSDRIPFLNTTTVTYGCTNKFYRMSLIKRAQACFAEHCVYEEPLFVYPLFLYANRISLITDALCLYYLHPGSTVTSVIGVRLLDHPQVQLQLLAYCMEREDLYIRFQDVICLYFLWSFYCETLCFAAQHKGAHLPLEYFTQMQYVCRRFFPDWRNNPQIQLVDQNTRDVLESIDREFSTQKELDVFILQAADILKS